MQSYENNHHSLGKLFHDYIEKKNFTGLNIEVNVTVTVDVIQYYKRVITKTPIEMLFIFRSKFIFAYDCIKHKTHRHITATIQHSPLPKKP